MSFNNSIVGVFIQSSIIFRNLLEKKLNEINLHNGQIFILIALWENDGSRQNEIAKSLRISSPTVNKMVKSLVKSGYVKCVACPKDARAVRVFLTDAGLGIRPKIEEIWSELGKTFQSNLTEPEKMILQQLLEKTFNNLIE